MQDARLRELVQPRGRQGFAARLAALRWPPPPIGKRQSAFGVPQWVFPMTRPTTTATTTAPSAEQGGNLHWQRNLAVCMFGSFTTIIAMTLLLPFLPLYVEQLGVTDHAAIVQWSGAAYGATFLSAALVAPSTS